MANPQKENGYTPIAHTILEALSRHVLSPDEWRILMVIFRKTYGWNKKTDSISLSEFSKITGIPRHHISRTVSKLTTRNIIYRVAPNQGTDGPQSGANEAVIYGFQKDFDRWVGWPPIRGLAPNQDRGGPQSGQRVAPKQGHTKEIIQKKITKENILFISFWKAYPKKLGKGAAEKAWDKIKPTPNQDLVNEMILKINQFSNTDQWRKDGGQFIPMPSTWLNQRRWEDEIGEIINIVPDSYEAKMERVSQLVKQMEVKKNGHL